LAVDRHPRHADGATGAERDLAADIAELSALRKHRAPHDIVDLAGLDPGPLDRRF
jgi:hypothetical protein